jgi:hypothetical protein
MSFLAGPWSNLRPALSFLARLLILEDDVWGSGGP